MEHWEHLDWGLPLCLSNAVAHFFSDQRHMKRVPIFYKLGTQGITLQLEDQKVGERETTRGVELNPDSRLRSPDSSPPLQGFSLFLPFLFFFPSSLSVFFPRPLSWTFYGTFWEQGWPRKECLFEWFKFTCASHCNFPVWLSSEIWSGSVYPMTPPSLSQHSLVGESHGRKIVLLCLQIPVFLNYRNYNLKLPMCVSYGLLRSPCPPFPGTGMQEVLYNFFVH